MKKSEVLKYAQQGDPQAIALLLKHSLEPQGIQTMVSLQAGTLHILLESQVTPDPAYVALIERGLQKLNLAAIFAKAHVYGRAAGTKAFDWKTVIPLRADNPPAAAEDIEDTTATPSPVPLQALSPSEEESLLNELKPAWGFWCGWLMMSLVGSAIAFIAMYTFAGRIDRSFATTKVLLALLTFFSAGSIGLLVGLGQWVVFRREVQWSHAWIMRTAIGTFISTVIGILFGWYYQAVPTLPNALMFWLLMVLPIVVCQWSLLQQQLLNALLWLVIPTMFCTLVGLMIQLTLPPPFNLLDAAVITRWMLYVLSGELLVWLLNQNGLVEPTLQPRDAATYRRVAQRRYQFNHWFVLEWVGLTLVGWFVGYWLVTTVPLATGISTVGTGLLQLLRGFPPAVFTFAYSMTVDLPNVVSLMIWLGTVVVLQFVVLRQRLDGAIGWLGRSLLGALVGGFGVVVLRAVALLVNNWGSFGNAIPPPWELSQRVDGSLAGLIMASIWGAVVIAQLPFWQRRQFPIIGWLVANVGGVVFMVLFPGLREDLHLLMVTPYIALVLPALAISWMAAYSYIPAAHKA